MSELVYYMPIYLKEKALAANNRTVLDFCEFFKVVNMNACVIDRTHSLDSPIRTHDLYPIPQVAKTVDFGELCLRRARELLETGKQIYFMYSGGLDSTSMLVAFHTVIEASRELRHEQIVVCTSGEAVAENLWAWNEMVLPNYRISSTRDMLDHVDLDKCLYVQGENADQLFGSDRVFTEPELMHQPYSLDNLRAFLARRIDRPVIVDSLLHQLAVLVSRCPLPVVYMRDFLWWMNFTCKWQSVALRTLAFTSLFENGQRITLEQAKAFSTFFNTVEFQQLSMSGDLDRWGDQPTAYTYKAAAREFILQQTGWREYVDTKMKVGSLYHVLRQRQRASDAIGYENGELFAINLDMK